VNTYDDQLVIATILRAGLPLHEGLLQYFDDAQNAFVAAYRKYHKGEDFNINIEYCSTPDLTDKVLILADTMLATGSSLEMAYKRLCEEGEPKHTHLVCPICSAYAVEHIQKYLPGEKITLWVAAVDEELTGRSYIVPGLGDAGDLAYGTKK
jgi:uracil phosphoribosyltransferase